MATVTAYTAARTQEIEDSAIVSGVVVGDNLILTRFDGASINAGNVRGIQGPTGSTGDTAILIVTSGSRPALPFSGSVIYETDTKRLYKWDGTSWVYVGGDVICTSSTRPASPFAGLSIYETDSKRTYTYDGTAWIYTGGLYVCTFATRPATGLFNGFRVYETDTKRTYTYNGTVWVPAAGEMRCKAYRTTPQGINHAAVTYAVWTAQEYDTDDIWTPGGTADSLVIPANGAGLWEFIFTASWYLNANGVRNTGIVKNGSISLATMNDTGSAYWLSGGVVTVQTMCVAGDTIKGYGYQSAGTIVNLDTSYPLSLSGVLLAA